MIPIINDHLCQNIIYITGTQILIQYPGVMTLLGLHLYGKI